VAKTSWAAAESTLQFQYLSDGPCFAMVKVHPDIECIRALTKIFEAFGHA